jgi:hypothetical protein
MGTLWELDRNTLGIWKKINKKLTRPTLPSKGKKTGPIIIAC